MRIMVTLIVLALGLAVSAAAWMLSDGRIAMLFLPLLFGAPLLWRGRRDGEAAEADRRAGRSD
jgi:hypothetical protein